MKSNDMLSALRTAGGVEAVVLTLQVMDGGDIAHTAPVVELLRLEASELRQPSSSRPCQTSSGNPGRQDSAKIDHMQACPLYPIQPFQPDVWKLKLAKAGIATLCV